MQTTAEEPIDEIRSTDGTQELSKHQQKHPCEGNSTDQKHSK